MGEETKHLGAARVKRTNTLTRNMWSGDDTSLLLSICCNAINRHSYLAASSGKLVLSLETIFEHVIHKHHCHVL